MKENKYDDAVFFEKYREFPRSVHGLSASGEWPALKKLLPDFTKKRVLDIGCGFGWHCIYAAEHGAVGVTGIDISEKMLGVAREKTTFPQVTYQKMAMEDMNFSENSFDVVISSLAMHYTPDFAAICQNVYGYLPSGGEFIFSVEHPVFTAQGKQDWVYDENGEPEFWPVDRYFSEGLRHAIFLGEPVEKYHRTLTTYLQTLLKASFQIEDVVEPVPKKEMLETVPGMKNELRRPMMLLVRVKK